MASETQYRWWSDSNANPPVPPPAMPTLTAIQAPATIAGSMVNPYLWTLPLNPLITGSGPQVPPMGPNGPGGVFGSFPSISSTLPNGTHGTAWTATLTATGGTSPYTFTVTGMPAWMTQSGTGGLTLSGTPPAAGTVSVTITAYDALRRGSPATKQTFTVA